MSKKDLKTYLKELTKKQLEEQVLDLYGRFKPVKTYYNFVFNPKEEKLLDEAKFKIAKEYFPLNNRKPKTRRSVAQKVIKNFHLLGVDSFIIADIMLFNIETAQKYTRNKSINQISFYTSMLKSYQELNAFIINKAIQADFKLRVDSIAKESEIQSWPNCEQFEDALER